MYAQNFGDTPTISITQRFMPATRTEDIKVKKRVKFNNFFCEKEILERFLDF